MPNERRLNKMRRVLGHRQPDFTLVVENIHDPHNVSAILRSCDAAGIPAVHLVYTTESFPKLGKKSSASAKKWIRTYRHSSIDVCYRKLRAEGFSIFASLLTSDAVPLFSMDLREKTALVFGNEHRGVSDEAADKADGLFRIPMMGMLESLNVSVACAVSLFEGLRQRMENSAFPSPGMTEDEVNAVLEEWMKR